MTHSMLASRWAVAALAIGASASAAFALAQQPTPQSNPPAAKARAQQTQPAEVQRTQRTQRTQRSDRRVQSQQAVQSMRTGDGMLSIQARFPAEVHTGQSFTYEVIVQNATDQVTLHDIRLRHTEGNGLTIESIRQADAAQPTADPPQSDQPAEEPPAAESSAEPAAAEQAEGEPAETVQPPAEPAESAEPAADETATEQPAAEPTPDEPTASEEAAAEQPATDEQPAAAEPAAAAESPQPTAAPQAEQPTGDNRTLAIDKLQPGQSRTFLVTASADQDGPVQACLLVESYLPAICLQATAVKPELNIVKTAPEQSQLCDVIELVYTVHNDGTGAVGRFEIIDELADGLKTIEGEERLSFTVDELAAGDTRRFVARVYATQTGQFNSRAEARAVESNLQSRSENVGPNVVGADLEVTLDGRGAVPSNSPAVFTASVTNTGNAVAENVQVVIRYPDAARLRQLSEPQMTEGTEDRATPSTQPDANDSPAAAEQQAATEPAAQPADAEPTASDASTVVQASVQRPDQEPGQVVQQAGGAAEPLAADAAQPSAAASSPGRAANGQPSFTIGRLEPGQTAQFDYVLVSRNLDRIETQVEAQYVCELEGAVAGADSETRKTAQATAATRILRLPALQVYVVDEADPVATDQQVVYVIRVLNEGDAPDQKVAVTVNLPGQLKFASAEGPSEFQQQEQQITFEPVAELAPGDELEYRLSATAIDQGNVQIEVAVNSEALDAAVKTAEPTRLFSAEATE